MSDYSYLFLSQSYSDTYDDYIRSLTREKFPVWDYIIITASDERQAEGYRVQLEERFRDNRLPSRTHFAVLADPEGKRVGSGGATLASIAYIAKRNGNSDFSGLRILVIHSGGDSKRIPQYSALGKLFSPVPHVLPNGYATTLFDELIIGMSSVPSRLREGMMILSGDAMLLFNPLLIDYSGNGAAAISFKESVKMGEHHGVFLRGEDGNVAEFLHKQDKNTLIRKKAANDKGYIDIDTGAVIFSKDILSALYGLISEKGKQDDQKYNSLVNENVRLSLYGDFLYPLASDSTLEQYYTETPEGELTTELKKARTIIWNTLRPFRMKLLRLAPAKFIHFGTSREVLTLMTENIDAYSVLGWKKCVNSSIEVNIAGYNSVFSSGASIGKNCYLESSFVHLDASIGDNTIISYMDIQNVSIPSNVVVHGLKLSDSSFVVRIYGIDDDPKQSLENGGVFLGIKLSDFMENNDIDVNEMWELSAHTLWDAKLYPVCDTIEKALTASLNVYNMVHDHGNVELWRSMRRISLHASSYEADISALMAWDKRMKELVQMDKLAKCIDSAVPVSENHSLLNGNNLTRIQQAWLQKKLAQSDFSTALRLKYYIGKALGGIEGDRSIEGCFKLISDRILDSVYASIEYDETYRIKNDRYTVKLPLRVNFGGGWSDTPPYCIENGGTVINAAIKLNKEYPVEVSLEQISEKKIVFDSRDMDVHGEFEDIRQLQLAGDPQDPFALQKAAIISCGVIPKQGGDLKKILARLGGGFIMRSEVMNVPKGSGLGTSSILAAACVKAIFGFLGQACTNDKIYTYVLSMEQIMSTGGGWQDQVGGVSKGIKYITSAPGFEQELQIEYVQISQHTRDELNRRFALIYTGQRRLARNLLRDVIGRYIGNETEAVYALNEIQRIATLMKFELQRGNVDGFAALLDRHWELSKMIDSGSTNTLIDQILICIDEYIVGRMICGAGGGGFLQVVLKKDVKQTDVRARLKEVFQDSDIDLWECEFVF